MEQWFYNKIMDPLNHAAELIRAAISISEPINKIMNWLAGFSPYLAFALIVVVWILFQKNKK